MIPGLRDYWFFLKAGINPADCPELRLAETEELRQQIIDRFYESQKNKTSWVLFWLAVRVAFVLFGARIVEYSSRGPLPHWLSMPLAYLGVAAFGTITLRIWGWKTLPTFIRKELRRHGYPVCLHCGYNLQGQVDPRCPECGNKFDAKDLGKHGDTAAEPPPRKRSKLDPWVDLVFWMLFVAVVANPSMQFAWVFGLLAFVFLIWTTVSITLAMKNATTVTSKPKRQPPQRPRIEHNVDSDS